MYCFYLLKPKHSPAPNKIKLLALKYCKRWTTGELNGRKFLYHYCAHTASLAYLFTINYITSHPIYSMATRYKFLFLTNLIQTALYESFFLDTRNVIWILQVTHHTNFCCLDDRIESTKKKKNLPWLQAVVLYRCTHGHLNIRVVFDYRCTRAHVPDHTHYWMWSEVKQTQNLKRERSETLLLVLLVHSLEKVSSIIFNLLMA